MFRTSRTMWNFTAATPIITAATPIITAATNDKLPSVIEPLNLPYMMKHDLRAKFDSYDIDGDGTVDATEMKQMLLDAGVETPTVPQAEEVVAAFDANDDGRVSWEEFEAIVNKAASPVDKRVRIVSANLSLYYIGLGIQLPILPKYLTSLGLDASSVGNVIAVQSTAKLLSNVAAATLVDRVGRKPLIVGGAFIEAVAMAGIGMSSTSMELGACMGLAGLGGTLLITGVSQYLNDISTPLNRSQTTMPLMMTALVGMSEYVRGMAGEGADRQGGQSDTAPTATPQYVFEDMIDPDGAGG
jgi:hypothetical protein